MQKIQRGTPRVAHLPPSAFGAFLNCLKPPNQLLRRCLRVGQIQRLAQQELINKSDQFRRCLLQTLLLQRKRDVANGIQHDRRMPTALTQCIFKRQTHIQTPCSRATR